MRKRRKASADGEHEGLLLKRGRNVAEGATSSFYAIRDGVLMVPPTEDILDGVTLQIVLRLAASRGIPVAARAALADLPTWDEAFLTSTSRHVLPLVRLNGRTSATANRGR
ncbi:MAG: aminotransferase class IV [Caldilineaceae bacterium]